MTVKPRAIPSNCGRRLLPTVIDEIAVSTPQRTFVSIPRTFDPKDGFEDITFQVFARAIDRCSWWIEENLGSSLDFECISYMGPQDIRYAILVISAIKTGYKLFFTSPRNSTEAELSLLQSTQCKTILFPRAVPPLVKMVLSKTSMRSLVLPEVEYWLVEESIPVYPFLKGWDEARNEPFLMLHTSGSTGTPKAITLTHGTAAVIDAYQLIPSFGGQPLHADYWSGHRIFMAFPLFHAAGIFLLTCESIYYEWVPVLPPPVPLTGQIASSVHTHGNVQGNALPSAILIDISKNPAYMDELRRLKWVTFSGGPLPKDVGNALQSEVHLNPTFGTTETCILPTEVTDSEDWGYLKFSPFLGQEYRFHGEDLYQHVIVHNKELEQFQGIFSTFPELKEYPTKDLYSKHPSKSGLWRYRGRSDDIIVFSTGEKLNPLTMEGTIESHPAVRSALISGNGRFQSALLIEAQRYPSCDAEKASLLLEIWSTVVQQANKVSPAYGRVTEDMIMFTSVEKPILRAGKGTIQRKSTIDSYTDELDSLYDAAASENDLQTDTVGDRHEHGNLRDWLYEMIYTKNGLEGSYLSDFFGAGIDSLQVVTLVKQINRYLAKDLKTPTRVTSKALYENGSISKLELVLTKPASKADSHHKMQSYLTQYSSDLPITARLPASTSSNDGFVVLLTGSTGSLGSYLLDALLHDSRVIKVICLNRSKDARSRQEKSQAIKGLDTKRLKEQAQFLQCDLSRPFFGLEPSEYKPLLHQVTHIIHNAWEVDFNRSIDHFAPTHIHGVRSCIDFSSRSAHGAFIFFISTIGTVLNREGTVSEEIATDWSTPLGQGYAESKFVSERLLAAASAVAGVPSAICRVGQVAGPTSEKGVWAKSDWLPSMIASSNYLGKIPESLGPLDVVDWIPVDLMARIIVDLLHNKNDRLENWHKLLHFESMEAPITNGTNGTNGTNDVDGVNDDNMRPQLTPQVYHSINPYPTNWSTLVPTVQAYLSSRNPLHTISIVPFSEWIDTLGQSSTAAADVAQNPALKLLAFFENLQQQTSAGKQQARLETRKTVECSETMRALRTVDTDWMDVWMRQWAF